MSSDQVFLSQKERPPCGAAFVAAEFAQSAQVPIVVTNHADATKIVTSHGDEISGNSSCCRYLSRRADRFFAQSPLDATRADDFVALADRLVDKATLPQLCVRLNAMLAMRTVFVGFDFSVADFLVWGALKGNPRWLGLSKKTKDYPHLIRWFAFCNASDEFARAAKALTAKEQTKHAKSSDTGSWDIGVDKSFHGRVVTRFPPEPSGYLHIGHAKAALINDEIAKRYDGRMIVRFDDTNPSKEKDEYVDNIIKDLETLQVTFDPAKITHSSNYFDLCVSLCEKMIAEGNAYVDETPVLQMREERMEGIESVHRNRTIAENMALWKQMQAATEKGLTCCVRAKMDMQHNNKCLRDPAMYRCNLEPHHRTGTKYKVYPTYDFCCPIIDTLEGVTHAMRTTEYHDRNPQYYWIWDMVCKDHPDFPDWKKPIILDYSRLNFVNTCLSKRKLKWFVDEGLVDGWMDPRFPTVQGMVRRGLTIEALREFCHQQAASKNVNLMEWDKIWAINKKINDPVAHRFTAISDQRIPLTLSDAPESSSLTVQLHPKTASIGTKQVPISKTIFIERDDANGIADGEEVTLMGWGNAVVESVTRDAEGKVVSAKGNLNLKGSVKSTKKKLTWLADVDLCPAVLVELDHLITCKKLEEGMQFEKFVNPITRYETPAIAEPTLRNVKQGQIVQLNRRGFFICDKAAEGELPAILIFIPDGKAKKASSLSTKVNH